MKRFIGLFVLVIVLAMISGCTQPAKTANVTTVETTIVPTTMATTVPIPEATSVTTTVPVATITQNITTTATTVATIAKTPAPVMTPSTKITTIYIRNNTFVPKELTVLPGTGVIWMNDDATIHAIKTTGSHAGMFSSGDFVKGSQWDYTFGANEGTFDVIDTYSNATCVIIVKKGESLVGNNPTIKPTTT
ncbi:MAG: cupredoxin domain-containing protein [Methanoregula sp.]